MSGEGEPDRACIASQLACQDPSQVIGVRPKHTEKLLGMSAQVLGLGDEREHWTACQRSCVGWEYLSEAPQQKRGARWQTGGSPPSARVLRAAALVASVPRVSAVCLVRMHLQVAPPCVEFFPWQPALCPTALQQR